MPYEYTCTGMCTRYALAALLALRTPMPVLLSYTGRAYLYTYSYADICFHAWHHGSTTEFERERAV